MRIWWLMLALAACTDADDKSTDLPLPADADGDGFVDSEDCEPENAAVFPEADEVCNGIDDDCDGVIDGPGAQGAEELFVDADGDGFGDRATRQTVCPGPGFVASAGDCDDSSELFAPGASEICDELDNNCDGVVDGGQPCVDGVCELPVALESVRVGGGLLYDGTELVDGSVEPEFQVTFTDATGVVTSVELDGAATWQARIAPGVYDVDFELLPAAAVFRQVDGRTRIAAGVDLTTDATLDIDVVLAELTGGLLYDGVAPVAADPTGPEWELTLRDEFTGAVVQLGMEAAATYTAVVYPGTYTIDFQLLSTGAVASPVLSVGRVDQGVVVAGDTIVDIAMETSSTTGAVVYDGGDVAPSGAPPDFQLRFTEVSTGLVTTSGYSGAPSFNLGLFAGVYDVDFKLWSLTSVARPSDAWVRVVDAVDLTEPDGVRIEVPISALSGSILYDGESIQRQSLWFRDYQMVFVNTVTGESHIEQRFGDPEYLVHLPHGVYDLFFELLISTSVDRPVLGRHLVASALDTSVDQVLDIDLPVYELSGSVAYDSESLTIDGVPAIWRLHAINGDGGHTQQFNGGEAFSMRLLPGTYDIEFELADPSAVPTGAPGRIRLADAVVVEADTVLDLDLRTVDLSGMLSVDGMAVVPDEETVRTLSWSSLDSDVGGSVVLGEDPLWSTRMYAGDYDLSLTVTGEGAAGHWTFGSCVTLE